MNPGKQFSRGAYSITWFYWPDYYPGTWIVWKNGLYVAEFRSKAAAEDYLDYMEAR